MCKKILYSVSFIFVLSLVLANGVKAADPNLVGHWPLDDGAGDVVIDVSGNGNDGTIYNPNAGMGLDSSVWLDDPERGTVISFLGTAEGAYVRAGSIPQMTLTNDFTWVFWAKQNAENTANNDIILGNRMDENAVDFVPRQFIKFTPTKFEWHMNGNGNDNLEYDDIPADVWLHHAVVKTADQLTYYRDGVASSSGLITQALDFPQPLFFGGDNEGSSGENWNGMMSDVRIYNRSLTGLEIQAAMKGVERIDMEIPYAIEPPVIDGQVDGIWAIASTQSFVPLEDPADGSGIWKVLYDAENLYVMVDITDDSLQNDSASAWQDDSVEVYFDGGNTKLSTPLSGDDHQYTFGWTADDIQGTNITGYTDGIEQAQVTTETGWRIEVKMPWLSIQGVGPLAGDLIGIDCYYNDDDDGGDSREGKMLSISTVEGWNDASQWGTAILAVAPEPVEPGTEALAAAYVFEADAADSSGNALDGTLLGDAYVADGVLVLDGDNDAVAIPGIGEGLSEFTFSMMVYPTVDVTPLQFSGGINTDSWTGGVHLKLNNGRLNVGVNGLAGGDVVGTSIVEPNKWTHLALTVSPTEVAVYVNGLKEGSRTGEVVPAVNVGAAAIGAWNNGGTDVQREMTGMMDDVLIYNRALSANEILYLAGYRADTDDADPSLVIYYTFDEVGDIVADQSGKGLDGVVVGDISAADGILAGAGKFATGSYLDLDGPSIPAEDIPTSAMTLSAWINCENTGGDHEIFNARASDNTWVIHPEPKGSGDIRWLLRSYGGTTIFQIRAGTMTWGEWLHFAGTYDKASAKAALYINSELIQEMDVDNPADIAGDWNMGARVGLTIDDARPFTGLMDEFRMYTRALSQEEITGL